MYGDGIGSLNIYKRVKSSDGDSLEILLQKKGDQDNIWRLGTIGINSITDGISNNYSIIFEGIKGKTERGSQ
jgi:hypothetical protein